MVDVYELKIHERITFKVVDKKDSSKAVHYAVTRVPGGWIYEIRPAYTDGSAVFVPYSDM